MNLDNLTIPEYWVQLGIGDVYKITMIKQMVIKIARKSLVMIL